MVLILIPLLVSLSQAAPVSTDLDTTFATTFEKFFRIKDLIDNINIKHFRALQGEKDQGGAPEIEAIEDASSDKVADTEEPVLTEIDLTEEAISNDQVTKKVTSEPIEAIATEATGGIFEEVTLALGEEISGKITTTDSSDRPEQTEDEAETTTAVITQDSTDVEEEEMEEKEDEEDDEEDDEEEEKLKKEEDSSNEIDTDGFVVSQDTLESAKKYGYKILLKKVDGRKVPVGKIKFTLPIYYHHTPLIEATAVSATETTTSNSVLEDSPTEAPPTADSSTETATPTSAPAVTGSATDLDIPTTKTVIVEDEVVETTTTTMAAEDDVIYTTAIPTVTTTLEVKELNAEDPILSDLPEIDTVDQTAIEEGALQVKANTELAVAEIENLNQTAVLSSSECSLPLVDSQKLLVDLATKIVESASAIEEILAVARSIKDEVDPAALSLSGARLLQLLEPFLESLVPVEIASCPDTSTNLLMTMTGMAATLDTIAEQPGVEAARAESLHQAATSLQLAAWAMAQLQSSVHTLYSGVCEEGKTSSADILASLARALEGYVPMLAMLSTDTSVEELRETTEALQKAADDIFGVEQRSGSRLPGVECGASFSDMSAGLERLADFLEATQEI